jgi:hypothetical protein
LKVHSPGNPSLTALANWRSPLPEEFRKWLLPITP